jgi:predicted DNA-binding transcriptional regulator AlpA
MARDAFDCQNRLITLHEFARRLDVSKRTLRRLELTDPTFPKRIQKTRKLIWWRESEVIAYLTQDVSAKSR